MGLDNKPEPHPCTYDWNQPMLGVETAVNQSAVEQWDDLDGTILELFQLIPDGSPRLHYQARELEVICPPSKLQELRQVGVTGRSSEIIAWLDDRSQARNSTCKRKLSGWLTRSDLYKALRAKRIHVQNDGDVDESHEPNAERRLIYLPNPDWQGLSPIILTASRQEAGILSIFLWKHMIARCSIQASVSTSRHFSLEFHLPFFVWKDTKSILRDKRIRSDKFPLRKSRLLSFLERSRPTSKEGDNLDCLHESQWSCVVTGFNNTVWNVYGFTDTYFYDTDDEFDRVSVNYYQRCLEDEDRMEYDPIIGSDANLPIQDPREYFVATLLSCMNHILEEWNNIITRLERKMCYYIDDEDFFFDHDKLPFGPDKDHSKSLQDSYGWTQQVTCLLTHLRKRIRNLNKAWESFRARDTHSFDVTDQQSDKPNRTRILLCSIDTIVTELNALEVQLGDLWDKNEDFRKSLELYLQVENNRTIVLQQFNISFIQIISPPALAATMMQSRVLPWTSGFLPWLIVTAILWILMAAVRPALTWYHRYMGSKPRASFVPPLAQEPMMNGFHWQQEGLRLPQPTFAAH
ncbi:hypothetical protein BGZ61DRAFT_527800 [Ilyonectria robusta]|uniref:uncharacterized protein n=1 Tax=Ilyonectria robusta TaxID=1079257 RepID=UPI001E8E2788|nr:uncharacterized protein BGZ61DRAFT_527800 [Ilyonectria robusta]KAH8734456.1 hypothetical protein BGZ61DRAFT_527800 [Ilyonectria robusta]